MSFCKLFQLPTFNLPYTLSRREGSMKCYAFFSCFQERKMNCFSIFTKEIVMADFSYLLKKTHCLMLLSFVSRQRLDLWSELPLNQPAESPPLWRRAPGRLVLVWPRCHFTSCWSQRSNPGSCDSAVHLGPDTSGCSRLRLLSEQHGRADKVPGDCLSQDTARVSVPALSQPRQHSYLAGRKLQSKWHSVPTLNICSPWANGGNKHSGKPAALCTVGFSGVGKTLMTHLLTVSYTHPDKEN